MSQGKYNNYREKKERRVVRQLFDPLDMEPFTRALNLSSPPLFSFPPFLTDNIYNIIHTGKKRNRYIKKTSRPVTTQQLLYHSIPFVDVFLASPKLRLHHHQYQWSVDGFKGISFLSYTTFLMQRSDLDGKKYNHG